MWTGVQPFGVLWRLNNKVLTVENSKRSVTMDVAMRFVTVMTVVKF